MKKFQMVGGSFCEGGRKSCMEEVSKASILEVFHKCNSILWLHCIHISLSQPGMRVEPPYGPYCAALNTGTC